MKLTLPAVAAAALLLGATALHAQQSSGATEGGAQGLGTPGGSGTGIGNQDYGGAPNTPGASDYAPGRMNDYGAAPGTPGSTSNAPNANSTGVSPSTGGAPGTLGAGGSTGTPGGSIGSGSAGSSGSSGG